MPASTNPQSRATERRALGGSGVEVTLMSFGGAPIGNFLQAYDEAGARTMVDQAWELGMRLFDTAPGYGNGLSEHRLGHALYERPRNEYTISSKVGRVLRSRRHDAAEAGTSMWVDPPFAAVYDYSYDGVMRSFEDSLQRLLTDRIDVLLMHDVDRFTHGPDRQPVLFEQALSGGFKALESLRDQGAVSAIGIGVNESDICAAAVRASDLDCVLLAGRYTLLEQDPLDDLLPLCEAGDVGVILGGVFNSGILATGARAGAKFNYGPAPEPVLARTRAIAAVCDRHQVPLAAVAAQFAAAHPVVSTICLGSRNTEQQRQNVAWLETPIPAVLWEDLRGEGLVRGDAPTP